ncbi:MAG: AAA family ATPase [Rhodospirillales bacterium]|nr:AAA family ATPase [Rhodospirillales bacterium]
MIYKIEIENFRSIRDRQFLDLRAPANAPKGSHRLARCWRDSDERCPKVVAVFGANGSGKSNLLRSVSFVAWFLSASFGLPPGGRIPLDAFNDAESLDAPTRVRLWLAWVEDLGVADRTDADECPYCYEVVIGNGKSQKVISEAIFFWPTSTGRKTRLIERFEDGTVKAAMVFGLSGYKGALEKVLRPNASVISTLAQLNHPISVEIAVAAEGIRSNIFIEKMEFAEDVVLRHYIDRPEMVDQFNREISRVDVGVRALEVRQSNDGPQVWFRHEGLAVPMPPIYESHGTRQFLRLFPLISDSLATGGIVIIDELDAAVHAMILPEIVGWFHDPVRNPHNAQLWMSCHSVSLLEELSKDEVVFCEKDWRGRTEIYGLNDVKAVRRSDNFYKKYLGGAFGAVPRIG